MALSAACLLRRCLLLVVLSTVLALQSSDDTQSVSYYDDIIRLIRELDQKGKRLPPLPPLDKRVPPLLPLQAASKRLPPLPPYKRGPEKDEANQDLLSKDKRLPPLPPAYRKSLDSGEAKDKWIDLVNNNHVASPQMVRTGSINKEHQEGWINSRAAHKLVSLYRSLMAQEQGEKRLPPLPLPLNKRVSPVDSLQKRLPPLRPDKRLAPGISGLHKRLPPLPPVQQQNHKFESRNTPNDEDLGDAIDSLISLFKDVYN